MVSSGFVLRLIAGALACNLIISEWFLIVGGFGALFIVTTKRLAEWRHQETRIVRRVLSFYTSDFLQSTISIAIAVCVTSYAFWVFNQTVNPIWYQISLIPFVIALIRYRWLAEKTIVEKPEDALFSDYPLLILGVFNLISLVIAIY
jgi:decaprenyl-phosphate phosphoribosyltransferase